jgi:hypothetical protein
MATSKVENSAQVSSCSLMIVHGYEHKERKYEKNYSRSLSPKRRRPW